MSQLPVATSAAPTTQHKCVYDSSQCMCTVCAVLLGVNRSVTVNHCLRPFLFFLSISFPYLFLSLGTSELQNVTVRPQSSNLLSSSAPLHEYHGSTHPWWQVLLPSPHPAHTRAHAHMRTHGLHPLSLPPGAAACTQKNLRPALSPPSLPLASLSLASSPPWQHVRAPGNCV